MATTTFSEESFASNLSSAERAKIGRHKAAIRKAFIHAASELNHGDWTPDDDAAVDAATLWLGELIRRGAAPPPRQITAR